MKKKLTADQRRAKQARIEVTSLLAVIIFMAVFTLVVVIYHHSWWHLLTVAAFSILALLVEIDREEGEENNWKNY